MSYLRFLVGAIVLASFLSLEEPVQANGSSGGYGSSGGSSGGGFLSRLRARSHSHGSSGGYVRGGSSGGYASSGSSGGRVGPLGRLMAKIRARKAARGSSGGAYVSRGSSGGTYASRGGSSGGAVRVSSTSYTAGGSTGSYAGAGSSGGYVQSAPAVSYSQPIDHAVTMGATEVYESPMIESSYETYAPPVIHSAPAISGGAVYGESIIENGMSSGVPVEGSTIEGSAIGNEPSPPEPGTTSPSDAAPADAGATGLDSASYESEKPAIDPTSAMLTVAVPDNAKVTVNGHPTKSDGKIRQFMSRGLKDGFVYTYVVQVSYDLGGEEKTDSKSIKLRAGDIERVVFEKPVVAKKTAVEPITVVKLHVPAGAEVSLAGNPTKGSGEVRTFRTKQLKEGQQWKDYTVRVTANVNGRAVSRERTIDVKAGSTTELTFDFDSEEIAQR